MKTFGVVGEENKKSTRKKMTHYIIEESKLISENMSPNVIHC
jgi:hypothetical protein